MPVLMRVELFSIHLQLCSFLAMQRELCAPGICLLLRFT